MQSVSELDKNNADILSHRKKHLAQVFHVLVFFVVKRDFDKLCQPVHDFRDLIAKFLFDFRKVYLIGAILQCIMKQSRTNGIGVKPKSRYDFRNGDGMTDIRLSAFSELPFMQLLCKFIGLFDFFKIIVFSRRIQGLQQIFISVQHSNLRYCDTASFFMSGVENKSFLPLTFGTFM